MLFWNFFGEKIEMLFDVAIKMKLGIFCDFFLRFEFSRPFVCFRQFCCLARKFRRKFLNFLPLLFFYILNCMTFNELTGTLFVLIYSVSMSTKLFELWIYFSFNDQVRDFAWQSVQNRHQVPQGFHVFWR